MIGTVTELTIRPTAKFINAGWVLAGIVLLGLEVGCLISWNAIVGSWVMLVPLLVLLWPAMRALRRRLTQTVISGDRLRYETGLATKSTRTIQLSKVQDVRVDQRLLQRVFSVGDLSIETAGEASRLTIHNVDNPQALADEIMNRAQRGTATA
ncbi:MAG TPA: PH domain-containing protein [Bryobacteraceae bacterium]